MRRTSSRSWSRLSSSLRWSRFQQSQRKRTWSSVTIGSRKNSRSLLLPAAATLENSHLGRFQWRGNRASSTTTTQPRKATHNQSRATTSEHDRLIVVGSGVAGSAAALVAAETHQIPVLLVYAGNVATDCNSYWAQGGIIYRNYDAQSRDSAALLASDIHRAGAGLCQDNAVQKVSHEGPDRVRQLLLDEAGVFAKVPFDVCEQTGDLSLCLEASHAAPRILHKADHTGQAITQHLCQAVARHPLIQQQPHTIVTDLMTSEGSSSKDVHCVGISTLDRTTGQTAKLYSNQGVLLASGGLAGIYEHSTNPPGYNALGSSVALAVRATAEADMCRDLEYVQFHPTALYRPNEARFLLTEALRGEGAVLRNASGRAFAQDYHEAGELAPRDIVARAVFEESQKTGDQVFLDSTHRDANWLHNRFPSIQAHLAQRGLDLATDALPITPAAHYTCGGISTDLVGRTALPGLYAAGEAARTGLHGGNRLASTSLLEGLVFGASVADFLGSEQGHHVRGEAIAAMQGVNAPTNLKVEDHVTSSSLEPLQIENAGHRAMQLLGRLRRTMWDYVGVVRTPSGLETALEDLGDIRQEAVHLHATCPTLETTAVRDAAFAGLEVTRAAAQNRTSAGAHCIVLDAESDLEEDEPAAVAR